MEHLYRLRAIGYLGGGGGGDMFFLVVQQMMPKILDPSVRNEGEGGGGLPPITVG